MTSENFPAPNATAEYGFLMLQLSSRSAYGGYSAALSILKHPDVWAAASGSSSVTSWYHYDSIYTERYMWIPQENKAGYATGNAMNRA